MRTQAQFKARFLRDVAEHQMTILRDDGVYRHVRYKRPGTTAMFFDVVTWPGYLAYTGDMGTYVFTRVHDMFRFFRRDDLGRDIDLHYWAEKCEAGDKHSQGDGVRQFSHAEFRRGVRAYVRRFTRDTFEQMKERGYGMLLCKSGVAALRDLREAVRNDVLQCDDNEVRAYDAAAEFSFGAYTLGHTDHWRTYFGKDFTFEFVDFWEDGFMEYTTRFKWCCYALAWGIAQYDAAKEAAAQVEVAA